jgi:CYTH domain-containing protein
VSANELPKYTRWEHERKFLIPPNLPRPWAGASSWEIEDRYLDAGQLRLRSITDAGSAENTFKLCKKFPSDSAYSKAIVNIYLSREEYEFFRDLSGRELTKRRFHDRFNGHAFSIDVFGAELDGLILCEIEAASVDALMRIEFPPYAQTEVTEDPFFTGGALSRTSSPELARRLTSLIPGYGG